MFPLIRSIWFVCSLFSYEVIAKVSFSKSRRQYGNKWTGIPEMPQRLNSRIPVDLFAYEWVVFMVIKVSFSRSRRQYASGPLFQNCPNG